MPGTVVAGRYRLVALLGRGGMGEVYRADDLKLGQSVALKFLPRGLERDADRLARFLEEVRTARQVTHANVCRVYDIDEFEGQHFLSMEYVDGEDLASLLRRIGRLPEERGVELARQICAGLAAVHDAGVLHRDLKPANVMIDGRGRVRLTDFGLSSLAGADDALDARAGTPAYMAPEQHAGEGVSVQTDLYSLGLVLYELFTGRAVFEAQSVAELSSLHTSAAPSRPSSHVRSLDPVVERVVLRCLEKDPGARPRSALAVSMALPGGDPLAAALAAGETPSPELVAESGAREALRPALAGGLALLSIAVFLVATHWAGSMSLIAYLPFDKRPEVLQDRALELLAELGYTEDAYARPADRAWGWTIWYDVLRDIAAADSSRTRWNALRERPDSGGYWYRQSTEPLRPAPLVIGPVFVRGPAGVMNPPIVTTGEVSILMDLDGTLRRFEALPRRFAREAPSEPDWSPLFAAAGISREQFTEVSPRYQRFLGPDLRRAWVGTMPSRPGVEYRIEAGAFEGRPVLFNVAASSTLESLAQPPIVNRPGVLTRLNSTLPAALVLLLVAFVARLSWRNVSTQRADERGARRLAFALAGLFLAANALRAHALFGWEWAAEIWLLISSATFIGAIVWGTYLAAEPFGRQVWPTMFVSSSRLLSRSRVVWRDPLLGRSVLAGLLSGTVTFLAVGPVSRWLMELIRDTANWPLFLNDQLIRETRHALAQILDASVVFGMSLLSVATLIVLQRWVRRRWVAVLLGVIAWTLMNGASSLVDAALNALGVGALMFVLLRWGVAALLVAAGALHLSWLARAVDYGHWTSTGAVLAIVCFVVLAGFGAWAATGTAGDQLSRRR